MKKILTVILSLVGCALLALGAVGCGATGSSRDESKYTGFDVAESLVLNRGQFYELTAPIAFDVYENVLGVSMDVVDSKGDPAGRFLPSGFFALDTNGYTISYSTVLPNGQSLVKSTKVYVLEYTKDTAFHPVARNKSLDLRSFLPNPMPAGYEAVYTISQNGNVVNGAIRTGTIIGQMLEDGAYDVNISLKSATNTFNLRDLNVDVGNIETPVWRAGEISASDVQVEDYYNVMENAVTIADASKGEVPGKTSGKFYKIDPTEEQLSKYSQYGCWIKPMYSESYYQSFVGQGYKVKFSFRVALPEGKTWQPLTCFDKDTLRDAVQTFLIYAYYANETTIVPDVEEFAWIDVEMSLDKLVQDYVYFFTTVTGNNLKGYFLDMPRGHRSGYKDEVNPGGVDNTVHQDFAIYMSEATISK